MIKFFYLFFYLFHAEAVISSFPDQFINRADLGFANHNQYGPIFVLVSGDMDAIFQISTNVFDNLAANLSNVQSLNFLLNGQFDSSSGQADRNENTALLFNKSTGQAKGEATEILISSVLTQILKKVPNVFDSTGKWLTNQKKPECKVNKHLFCCQKGTPKLKGGKITTRCAPVFGSIVDPDFVKYAQWRRICRNCRQTPLFPTLSIFSLVFQFYCKLLRKCLPSLLLGSIEITDNPACQ